MQNAGAAGRQHPNPLTKHNNVGNNQELRAS